MSKVAMPFLDAPGFKEGIESGMPGEWAVAKEYGIVDGHIIGAGLLTEARNYRPVLHPELPSELMKVDPEDEQQILEFVKNYGVLGGYTDYMWPQKEEVEWFRHCTRVLNTVGNLIKVLKDGDVQAANSYRNERTGNLTIDGIPVAKLVHRTDTFHADTWLMKTDDPLDWVRHQIVAIINDNIARVKREPVVTPDGIQSYFKFSSLLDVIYWQLLNAEEGGNLKLCKMCQKPYISTDGRQRFCHKRPWQKETSESHCSMLYRQRKRRQNLDS